MLLTTQVGDLFASERSSHEGYTEIFSTQFVTLSRVELPVAKNTQKFFSKFSFQCSGGWSWRLARDLSQSRKLHVLGKLGQFLNLFSFPSNISDCSSSSFSEKLSNSPCHSQKNLHFVSFLIQIFKEKGMGFYFLTLFYIFIHAFPHFVKLCLSLCVLQCLFMGLLFWVN